MRYSLEAENKSGCSSRETILKYLAQNFLFLLFALNVNVLIKNALTSLLVYHLRLKDLTTCLTLIQIWIKVICGARWLLYRDCTNMTVGIYCFGYFVLEAISWRIFFTGYSRLHQKPCNR
jgi:hypothetical protein